MFYFYCIISPHESRSFQILIRINFNPNQFIHFILQHKFHKSMKHFLKKLKYSRINKFLWLTSSIKKKERQQSLKQKHISINYFKFEAISRSSFQHLFPQGGFSSLSPAVNVCRKTVAVNPRFKAPSSHDLLGLAVILGTCVFVGGTKNGSRGDSGAATLLFQGLKIGDWRVWNSFCFVLTFRLFITQLD